MLDPVQTKCEDGRTAAQHRALGLGCLRLTNVAIDTLYLFDCEIAIQALMHTFYTLNLQGKVQELFLSLRCIATLSARQV